MATTASISRLVVQYRRCEGLSALLQYATTSSRSSCIWLKTPPSPKLLASVPECIVQSLLERPESGRLSVKHAKLGKQLNNWCPTQTAHPSLSNAQRRRDICKLRDKAPVVSHKSQKLSHTLQTVWSRP